MSQAFPDDKNKIEQSDSSLVLSDREREQMQKALANPLDFPQEFRGWLEEYVRILLTSGNILGLRGTVSPMIGEYKLLAKDYTAQTGEYTVLDDQATTWLYCNGAQVSQTTYADLYAFFGANAFGTDTGGNFYLPDARGRAPWSCGTHTATDLGDNDGVTVASRQPKHTHTSSENFSIENESAHTHTAGTYQTGAIVQGITSNVLDKSGDDAGAEPFAPSSTSNISGSSGAGSAHTHTLSGGITSIGSGMSGSDAVAHIVLGSWVVRAL